MFDDKGKHLKFSPCHAGISLWLRKLKIKIQPIFETYFNFYFRFCCNKLLFQLLINILIIDDCL